MTSITTSASTAGTRYRPAILVVTGLAAAYSTYLLYQSFSVSDSSKAQSSQGRLRRSNAIHRPRRRLRHPVSMVPVHDHGMRGFHIRCQHGEHVYIYDSRESPTRDLVAERLRLETTQVDDVFHDLQLISIDTLFDTLLEQDSNTHPAMPANQHELAPFIRALRERDGVTLREQSAEFFWNYDQSTIDEAIARYLARDSIETTEEIQIEHLDDGSTLDDGAETLASDADMDEERQPGQGLKGLLYHIAEEEAKREAYIHRGTRCDHCGCYPIKGARWHCNNCPDYDLCSTCEPLPSVHPITHTFTKIKVPIHPLSQPHQIQNTLYPGRLRSRMDLLKPAVRRDLSQANGFEEAQVDAYFEQFACLANTESPGDLLDINMAIDKSAFIRATSSDVSNYPWRSSYLYDRMFAFYDTNDDGYINFDKFIQGVAHLVQPAKRNDLKRPFRGYDADGDGFISRSDFMRMLRAKYAVHKELILDTIAIEKAVPQAMDHPSFHIARSSQPISAAFSDEYIDHGGPRRSQTKRVDEFGDRQALEHGPYHEAVLADGESEIDNTFWETVFGRYGKPYRLSDLHPDFNSSLEARLNARQRYTSAETLPIGTDSSEERRYLARTDTRGLRPYSLDEEHLRTTRRPNLTHTTATTPIQNTEDTKASHSSIIPNILENGLTYDLPEGEKDIGQELVFQVVEEGFNELLDGIFKAKEGLAAQVRATRDERKRFKRDIGKHKNWKDILEPNLGLLAGTDPLLSIARTHSGNSNLDDMRSNRHTRRSTFEDAIGHVTPRNADSAWPVPPNTSVEPVEQSSPVSRDVGAASSEIQTAIAEQERVPTDEESLGRMESSIREQPLEELLQSAGYGVASPEDRSTVEEPWPSHPCILTHYQPETEESYDPTLPHHRPDAASTSGQNAESSPMHLSPSAPSTPSPSEPLTDLCGDSEGSGLAVIPDEIAVDPQPVMVTDAQNRSNNARIASGSGKGTEDPQENTAKQAYPSPTTWHLAWLSMLDDQEAEIIERGGPGRVSLAELEQIFQRDDIEHGGRLRGIFMSWLEWTLL